MVMLDHMPCVGVTNYRIAYQCTRQLQNTLHTMHHASVDAVNDTSKRFGHLQAAPLQALALL